MKPTSFATGQVVGRYTIRKLLAQGGMAEVYKADQELTAGIFRPVALKVIRPEYSESPDFREMFLDEARCACGLSHPHIVQIFDVGEAEGLLYMAMELVPGETLSTVNRTLREHQDKFTDEALYAIGIYCAGALEAVHALKLHDSHVNLVHRDVSPHNLLLSSRGSLKLIDFGIAKAATNRNLTSPGVTKGKAGYFSPEQAMGKPLDGRSDLFSLGVTLYKLAYGQTPFDGYSTHAERNGALVRGLWKPLEQAQPGLSPGLYEVVARAMKLKSAERYASASEMREALEHAAFAGGVRVGASSLLGYVTDDGEITAVPTGSRLAAVTQVPPSPDKSPEPTVGARPKLTVPLLPLPRLTPRDERERVTDKMAERPKSRPRDLRPALLAGAFLIAVGIGTGITLALSGAEAPKPAPLPAPPPQAPIAKVTDPAPPEVEPEEPEVNPIAASDRPDRPEAPRPAPRPIKHAPPKPAVPKPEEVAAEEIPAGEGQLRIGIQPANVVSRVMVGRDDWGPAPVTKKLASGRYVVSVRLPDGKKSPEWRGPVLPDATTVLIYDIDAGRWQRR